MEKLNLKVVSISLAVFVSVIYTLCVIWDLLFPSLAMNSGWIIFFPGFKWISIGSFFLGLIEAFIYGLLGGVVFVPIYNYFSEKWIQK